MLSFARPHTPALLAALLVLAGNTAAGLAVPLVLARLLDSILLLGQEAALRLNQTVLVLVGLFVARGVSGGVQSYLMARVGERVVLRIRRMLYDHLTCLDPSFYDDRRVGELLSRVMNDVTFVQSVVTSDLAALLTNSLTFLGALAILVWRNWRLTALIVLVVPPLVLLARLYGRRMHRLSIRVQDRMADASAAVEESLGAIRLVQSFVREPYERARFKKAASGIYDAALGRARSQAVFGSTISVLTFGVLAVVLWFGGREVLAGRLQVGDLVAFVVYSGMMATSASGLVSLYGRLSGALGASRRVFELLDRPPAVADRVGAGTLDAVAGRVTFENVRFAYDRGDEVLKGIDLEIAPGETLALVGPSGAGKSTLMHLIARFYDPVSGRLLVDGVDVREVTLASLRAQVGLVPQEVVLFNATVAVNLRYGRLDATDDEVEAAARAANAHDFIARLPDGYQTLVGERGVRVSAGERQRIAIARALLKDPRILLLDEATSSLDSESEELVQKALERLMAGRTTIAIAHRLSTVRSVDRIAVVDGGRIVELGTHEALRRRGGLYSRLCALQFREPESEKAG